MAVTVGALLSYAGLAELADALDLGSSGQPCGFESHVPHQKQVEAFRKVTASWTVLPAPKYYCIIKYIDIHIPG